MTRHPATPPLLTMPGLVLLYAIALSGCSTNKEDQDFYERGWLWPRSIDTPDRPVTAGERSDAANAAAHPARDW